MMASSAFRKEAQRVSAKSMRDIFMPYSIASPLRARPPPAVRKPRKVFRLEHSASFLSNTSRKAFITSARVCGRQRAYFMT
jgi:hypothetical protein